MSVEMIQQKLLSYNSQTLLEEENALKEIAQEIALMSLSRTGFFRVAAFQGGTCLRILYGLERFSEDLDFVLDMPDKKFNWDIYIKGMTEEFKAYVPFLLPPYDTEYSNLFYKNDRIVDIHFIINKPLR